MSESTPRFVKPSKGVWPRRFRPLRNALTSLYARSAKNAPTITQRPAEPWCVTWATSDPTQSDPNMNARRPTGRQCAACLRACSHHRLSGRQSHFAKSPGSQPASSARDARALRDGDEPQHVARPVGGVQQRDRLVLLQRDRRPSRSRASRRRSRPWPWLGERDQREDRVRGREVRADLDGLAGAIDEDHSRCGLRSDRGAAGLLPLPWLGRRAGRGWRVAAGRPTGTVRRWRAPSSSLSGRRAAATQFDFNCWTKGSLVRKSPKARSWPDCGDGTTSGSVRPSPPGTAAAVAFPPLSDGAASGPDVEASWRTASWPARSPRRAGSSS